MKQKELNAILDGLDVKAYSMLREWLFNKANTFALSDEGDIAVNLHIVSNNLTPVIKKLDPNYFRDSLSNK